MRFLVAMMNEYKGLLIEDNGVNNIIEIDEGCVFEKSRLIINGNDNVIFIGKSNIYHLLVINLKGNNKKINIERSSKNIRNLKISSIRGNNQSVAIGKNFSCGGIEIQMNDGNESCIIGDDCLFSWGIKLRTSDGHSVIDLETNRATNLPKDVTIGDRVWVGEDAYFNKGSVVGNDCVVGSRTIVTKSFTTNNIVLAGYPAKIVKKNIKWDRRMPYEYNENVARTS
uniref:Acetyltransferase n=3 Tax=Vibrio parahaemolyticus TaxID=670 RepID=A0A7M1VQ18_VIBPH|nr:polysialic acid O-acetyltransferase [Vibrio parahaemolyticus]